ncbi:MAG: glycosyltransferase family 39 protein [Anaerolineae bacterium]|jgi:4-amino-4-deoxy-L-arabinose transferase-like glycosyltransferase|nr:glycosyltransferase family 39 protein [Anaerolineae bacterium]
MTSLRSLIIPLLILLIAAFARLYLLGEAPPGLQHDEIFKAQEGRALIEQGDFRVFYPSNQGHEGLYVWLNAIAYVLFGTSVIMVKFPAFACGMITVALTYRLTREIFNPRVAMIAAGLIAVSFWAISVNRMGLRANLLPMIALLVVWGTYQITFKRPSWPITILTGLALGAAIYTYTASFVVYLAYGAFLLVILFLKRAIWRELILIGLIGALLTLPMIVIRLTDPQGQDRVSTITRPLNDFLAGQPDELIGNAWGLIGMPFFTGDPEWRYNVANRPVFASPVGLLVYVGLIVLIWQIRQKPITLMFLIFISLGLIPSLLTVSAPSFLRSILALFPVMLCVGLAIDLIQQKRLVWVIGIGAIAITALTDWPAYFDTWIQNPEVQSIYRDDLEQLARYLENPPAGVELALISTPDTELDPLIYPYYQPLERVQTVFFNGSTNLALSTQPALLLISPLSQITPPHADWLTAENGTIELVPIYRQDGQIAYQVYQLNAQPRLTTRLTQLDPVYRYDQRPYPRRPIAEWGIPLAYPVNFGDRLQLIGVDLSDRMIATERDGVNLQLYFQPILEREPMPLNVFVHMTRLDGTVHAQRDLLGVPSAQWEQEIIFIQDNFVIAGPTPPGRYVITMGIYNFVTGERLAVLDATGQPITDQIVIGVVRVGR